jgi:hypothetical protein
VTRFEILLSVYEVGLEDAVAFLFELIMSQAKYRKAAATVMWNTCGQSGVPQ